VEELVDVLRQNSKTPTGSAGIDFLCNKALIGTQLGYHIAELQAAEAILAVACGIGVQATANIVDLPVIPANDTLSSQGMQGLWPSEERCAGCGDCVLDLTGGICPITACSKSLLNGMCGGQANGKCEVDNDRDCGWYLIYNRLKDLGQLGHLRTLARIRDFRKMDVPGAQRRTTRWSIEAYERYKAPNVAAYESVSGGEGDGQ
jgi:hypothetical protein